MASIPKSVKADAKKFLSDVNQELDTMLVRIRRKFLDFYKLYRTFEVEGRQPHQSKLFIPKIFEIIEKKTPIIVANDPRFVLTPKTISAAKYSGNLRDYLAFMWDVREMQPKMEKWVKDMFIYGTAIGKVDWMQDTKMEKSEVISIDEITGEEIREEVEEEVVTFEGPTFDLLNIFNFKCDPRVESLQDGIGVIEVVENVRWEDLEGDDRYDLSELKGVKLESLDADADSNDERQQQKQAQGIVDSFTEIDKKAMTLIRFSGKYSKEESKKEYEYFITAIAGADSEPQYVIQCEKNELGFRPYVEIKDRVVPHEFFGIGEVEPLEGPQIEYNHLRNSRIDFVNTVLNPEWIVHSRSGINPAQLIHRPNNIIVTDMDVNTAIRPLQMPTSPVSGLNEEAQMNKDFQTTSQTIDFTDRGGSQGFTTTATGVASRDAQAGVSANNTVKHLESGIAKVGEYWLKLAEKFIDDRVVIRYTNENEDRFAELTGQVFDDIQNNFSIKIEGGSTNADTAAGKARDSVAIGNLAAQFLALGVPVDAQKVFLDILRDSFQKTDAEGYIKQEPIPQPGGENLALGSPTAEGGVPAQGGKVPQQAPLPSNLL